MQVMISSGDFRGARLVLTHCAPPPGGRAADPRVGGVTGDLPNALPVR